MSHTINQAGGKLRAAVLFGGKSSEHEVSCMSAACVRKNLSAERYDVVMVGITKEGKWLLYTGPLDALESGEWEHSPYAVPAFLSPDPTVHGLVVLNPQGVELLPVDVVIPVLHGRNGEDGTMQGLLQLSGIPYVGCNTLSSAICMDKAVTHSLLTAANIEQAHYLWFYDDRFAAAPDTIKNKIVARLNFPVFVKPANAGSSVGISKVTTPEDLDEAIWKAAKEDHKIVVEEGIVGQEVECAVMGNRDADASVVGEIITGAEFYDYEDKYINGTSQTLIPARLPEEVAEQVRQTAVRAYRLLGCSGLSRVDFFVTEDHRVILNEINTFPGFTNISMYAKLRIAGGVTYSEMLDQLVELAFQKKETEIYG